MLHSFLLLAFLTLSASSQHILTETQRTKSFLRISSSPAINPIASQQDDKTVRNHPKVTSEPIEEATQRTEEEKEYSFLAQRMLQNEPPVLTSIQLTTIPPPPGPPGPGNQSKPTVVTTEVYVADVKNEEEIIIVVENNQDPLKVIETIENGQPQIANGEDVFISSWWTFEDEETAFENWEQLESFLGAQYGSEPAIGIDVNAEDVPVEIVIVVAEDTESPPPDQGTQNINEDLSTGVINLTDIVVDISAVDWGQYEQNEVEGVVVVQVMNLITTNKPKCKQVQSCQRVFVRPIGFRNVCKNQLVCPKA